MKVFTFLLALVLIAIHQLVPSIKVDATTLILLTIAFLPWFIEHVSGFEIPNVVKIDFRDAKSATDKVSIIVQPPAGEIKISGEPPIGNVLKQAAILKPDQTEIFDLDPNLSLVAFRIEIERRIRALTASNKLLNGHVPLQRMIRVLIAKDIVSSGTGSGLMEIVALGNRAAHGAEVSSDAAAWVQDVGPVILSQLDELLNDVEDT